MCWYDVKFHHVPKNTVPRNRPISIRAGLETNVYPDAVLAYFKRGDKASLALPVSIHLIQGKLPMEYQGMGYF